LFISSKLAPNLEVIPNPFKSNITIAVNPKSDHTITLNIYNILGSTVLNTIKYNLSPGSKSIEADLSLLNSGLYFLVVEYDNQRYATKIRKE
jgi:hypothetical protein